MLTRALAATLIVAGIAHAHTLAKKPTWPVQTKVAPDSAAGGWFINLGITGARAKLDSETPTEFEIAYIFPGTPADGRLQVGDRIIGANGARFKTPHKFGYGMDVFGYEGPMMDLGHALEAAQGHPRHPGRLPLMVRREGREQVVTLELGDTYGGFSKTYPADCPTSERMLDDLLPYLATRQGEDGHWNRGRPHLDFFSALALLASGEEQYAAHTERAARAFAAATSDVIEYEGLDCWKYTLYGIYLAEYHLATDAAWVIPELEEINRWLSKAQIEDGGWGHRPAHRPGGNGYGSICAMTAQAQLAWALMMRCGIDVDADKYRATSQFLVDGTNDVGYVWYENQSAHPTNIADMGRTGTSAVAHFAGIERNPEYRAIALQHARCIAVHPQTFPDTHGSPILGIGFTALGAAIDPTSFRQLMDANRWHFALAHCSDGTFYYQPNRDNNAQDYHAAPRLSASAVTALILTIPRGNLAMLKTP